MVESPALYWLPSVADWRAELKQLGVDGIWEKAMALANARLDFVQTNALDQRVQLGLKAGAPHGRAGQPARLAILGASTLGHLHAAIRVAGLRRGIVVSTYENAYGQYRQELIDPSSDLHRFNPTHVLFALDAFHVTAGVSAAMTETEVDEALNASTGQIEACWQAARRAFNCSILQQAVLPVFPPVLGGNEHVLAGSRSRFVARLNERLRQAALNERVDMLPLDVSAAQDGLAAWHDAALWYRAKQEVTLTAAPRYGDLVGRWLAATQGRSAKCLVLDLDNTLWGGAVGDDGLEGIELGQGSPLGEAYVAVQEYARELGRRGVILAVCSKNDEANAFEPFDKHPEMVLRRSDIASFVANWSDKATNIRMIADELNIGLDSLVFLDDNPFERELVRRELPMVAVPELPDDPALVPRCLADAGYFEALAVTEEDRVRTQQYHGNKEREALKVASTDIESHLRSLDMELVCRRFDAVGLLRIVQLINKTNQFNLTTRRTTEGEVRSLMADPGAFGLQFRLLDRFGDNGIIAIVIGRLSGTGADVLIDTWLMSCRVLGRQVEQATLSAVAQAARQLGARRLIGEYRPTSKNAMVRDHYVRLGFSLVEARADGTTLSALELEAFEAPPTFIRITGEEAEWTRRSSMTS